EERLRRHGRLRGVRRVHQDLPREGDTTGPTGLRLAPDRARRPLLGLRRMRGGLPRLRLRRKAPGGRL
ncbi:MAG: 4Fe-4S ferredoxin, iron-sulfur binding, partial [uncultured Rubrobacteraceae bacterium]